MPDILILGLLVIQKWAAIDLFPDRSTEQIENFAGGVPGFIKAKSKCVYNGMSWSSF